MSLPLPLLRCCYADACRRRHAAAEMLIRHIDTPSRAITIRHAAYEVTLPAATPLPIFATPLITPFTYADIEGCRR